MKRPHPASVILLGFAALLAASSRDGWPLLLAGGGLVLTAILVAGRHLRSMVNRSRWLLLTILVMFGWFTPGTPVPGIPGASQEGLLFAVENLARLLAALGSVAMILQALAPHELVAGMRSLLAPLAVMNIPRDRIAVRLALTLNEVDAARNGATDSGGEPVSLLRLEVRPPGSTDLLLGMVSAALALGAWLA